MKKNNAVLVKKLEVEFIPLSKLVISPTNPRKTFSQEEVVNLAEDIKRNELMHPITVRMTSTGQYEIVVGSRRFRAFTHLSASDPIFNEIPCFVRILNNDQVIEMQFSENLKREDINPMEEAEAFQFYITQHKMTVHDLAGRLNHGVSYVYSRLCLNNLSEKCRDVYQKDNMTLGIAKLLAKLPQNEQDKLLKNITGESEEKGGRYVYKTEEDVKRQISWQIQTLTNAPFDTLDATLPGGSCANCPKNTGCNQLLFPELTTDSKCTDSACFKLKTEEFKKIGMAAYKAQHNGSSIFVFDGWDNTEEVAKKNKIELESVIKLDTFRYEILPDAAEGTTPVFLLGSEGYSSSPTKPFVNRVVHYREKVKDIAADTDSDKDDDVEKTKSPLQIAYDNHSDYMETVLERAISKFKKTAVSFDSEIWLRLLFTQIKTYSFNYWNYYAENIHLIAPFKSARLELKWRIRFEENPDEVLIKTVEQYIDESYKSLYEKILAVKKGDSLYGIDIKEDEFQAHVMKNMDKKTLLTLIDGFMKNHLTGWTMRTLVCHSAVDLGLIEPIENPILPTPEIA